MMGKFRAPFYWKDGATPGRSGDGKNIHTRPDSTMGNAAAANMNPPCPFRKDQRTGGRGVAEKHHVLSQVGKADKVSAERSEMSVAVRGKEARSARNVARYSDREKRTRDVSGEPNSPIAISDSKAHNIRGLAISRGAM